MLDEVFASTIKLVVTVESHRLVQIIHQYMFHLCYMYLNQRLCLSLQILCEFELTIALGSVIFTESVYIHVLSSL